MLDKKETVGKASNITHCMGLSCRVFSMLVRCCIASISILYRALVQEIIFCISCTISSDMLTEKEYHRILPIYLQ